jgi:3-hydroxyethyl bacteriochlorophyllide a dehydrogenase
MHSRAVILEAPKTIALRQLELTPLGMADVAVEVEWSGISSGTEKLLWDGSMPRFPGMGYPLVPGYESIGRIVDAGDEAQARLGEWVFVPGASCYTEARGLFGGNAKTLIVPSARALTVPERLGQDGILFALAATALHALSGGEPPELIVGHGVLGRLLARLTIATGAPAPTVWDNKANRRSGSAGYEVIAPKDDDRKDYTSIIDASGSSDVLDLLMQRLARGGEIALAGFYNNPVSFAFPPAFQREARLRIAAEWQPEDLSETLALIEAGSLDLTGLISHERPADEADEAYPTAFLDTDCLKMVLDWRGTA